MAKSEKGKTIENLGEQFMEQVDMETTQPNRKNVQNDEQVDQKMAQVKKIIGNSTVGNLKPTTVITDIKVLINQDESKAKDSCPEGYTLIDEDLNKGAGGAYIFLCVKYGTVSILHATTEN